MPAMMQEEEGEEEVKRRTGGHTQTINFDDQFLRLKKGGGREGATGCGRKLKIILSVQRQAGRRASKMEG